MVELGCKIRELRLEKEWTQKNVAARLGVTISVISAYENSIRYPSYENLIQLAELFDVSTDYLLGVRRRKNSTIAVASLEGLAPNHAGLVLSLIDALRSRS